MGCQTVRSQQPGQIEPLHPPGAQKPTGNGNGNGRDLVNYRLSELERRMGNVEEKLDKINDTCNKIDTTLKSMATKAFVLSIFCVALGTSVATFLGHIILRSIGS